MARLEKAGWCYSISVRLQFWVTDAIAAIPESDWIRLEDYPEDGEAQIAQTIVGQQRLVVRRTRLVGAQAELWPDWRYFPFLTNRTDPLEIVEVEHRHHAVVELPIRDHRHDENQQTRPTPARSTSTKNSPKAVPLNRPPPAGTPAPPHNTPSAPNNTIRDPRHRHAVD